MRVGVGRVERRVRELVLSLRKGFKAIGGVYVQDRYEPGDQSGICGIIAIDVSLVAGCMHACMLLPCD